MVRCLALNSTAWCVCSTHKASAFKTSEITFASRAAVGICISLDCKFWTLHYAAVAKAQTIAKQQLSEMAQFAYCQTQQCTIRTLLKFLEIELKMIVKMLDILGVKLDIEFCSSWWPTSVRCMKSCVCIGFSSQNLTRRVQSNRVRFSPG